MSITFNDTAALPELAVFNLYCDADWSAYTRDLPKLMAALGNSLAVLTAWDGETLVGLIRAVGDGETILYIQDILVLKSYKRRGIGSALLNRLLAAYPHVRQKVLLTDEDPETRGFYEANGFQACHQCKLVAFVHFD